MYDKNNRRHMQKGRIEPRVVHKVKKPPRNTTDSKQKVEFEAKHVCLVRYLKMKHFHSIMKNDATDVGLELDHLYNVTG